MGYKVSVHLAFSLAPRALAASHTPYDVNVMTFFRVRRIGFLWFRRQSRKICRIGHAVALIG